MGDLFTVRRTVPFPSLLRKRPRGANTHARAAEFTAGFNMTPAVRGTNHRVPASLSKSQRVGRPNFLAHAKASSAENAQVVIPVEKRVIFFHFEVTIVDRIVNVRHSYLLHNFLQLALAVIAAVPTPGGNPGFADSGYALPAFFLFVTNQAATRMLA